MVKDEAEKEHMHEKRRLYEKPLFQYTLIFLVIATLVISIFSIVNIYELKKALIPKSIVIQDFLNKLTSHPELKSYAGTTPLNIVQINNNNFANLQSQITGLNASYIGSFIVQYSDRIVVYDYDNDKLKGNVNIPPQIPADLLAKLNKHSELSGLEKQQPVGGQLDESSLNTLKQQFPDVYKNAKVGNFLLRYPTKLIIYDYKQDKIINAVSISQ